ncbi:hypothetical protein ACI8AC_03835 [Geodermatophilus sp. SYSU D00758]
MPSVEAATRDAAIAAARERYGSSVRIVGVRRVRTGGVMGFFTTERYVAEVEELPAAAVPRRPASRAESAARIEAALRRAPVLPDPVDEVADLLGGGTPGGARPDVGLYSRQARPPAGRPAARAAGDQAPWGPAPSAPAARPAAPVTAARPAPEPARPRAAAPVEDVPAAPSPFTAALAQMVAADREVRAAVEEAVATAHGAAADTAPPGSAEPFPAAPAPEEPFPAGTPVDEPVLGPPVPDEPELRVPDEPGVRVPDGLAAPVPDEPAGASCSWDEEPVGAGTATSAGLWGTPEPGTPVAGPAPEPAAAVVPGEPALPEPAAAVVPEDPAASPAVVPDGPPAPPPARWLPPVPPPVVRTPRTVPPPAPVGPEWATASELPGPVTAREEIVAEVLRAALAHDTSDAALTDLLRGVLTGAATQEELRAADPSGGEDGELAVWVDAATESDEWEVDPELGSEAEAGVEPAVAAAVLAATASDPAPLPMPVDATTVLPPLSLLPPPTPGAELAVPPLLSRRPPVPPAVRRPGQQVARRTVARTGLATVTRLPVDQRAAGRRPAPGAGAPVLVPSVRAVPAPGTARVTGPEDAVVGRLLALGVPERLLGADFAAAVARSGTYAALVRALAAGLPPVPELPAGPGEVLLVVGPGVETLAAARSLAAALRLDGERLQWASRGDLAALAPRSSRITGIDAALERKLDADRAGTLTIVAVDAPLRGGSTWLEQMLAVFSPAGVWAVVEATRKPEDVGPWLDGLPRVDALVVQDTDLTADPAALLARTSAPVALLDGNRATAHRWASLLCERLESGTA